MRTEVRADEHLLLWVPDETANLNTSQLLADLESSLNADLVERHPTQHPVTVSLLHRLHPSVLECQSLYDHILRNAVAERPRQLHPAPAPAYPFIQYPSLALSPSTHRVSSRFDLTWPRQQDAHNSTESIVHACVGVHPSGSLALACIDSAAQVWDVRCFANKGPEADLCTKAWKSICAFVQASAVRCTVMLALIGDTDAHHAEGESKCWGLRR